jgi:hypothetical protein
MREVEEKVKAYWKSCVRMSIAEERIDLLW